MVFIAQVLREQDDIIRHIAVDPSNKTLAIANAGNSVDFYLIAQITNLINEHREGLLQGKAKEHIDLPKANQRCETAEVKAVLMKMCFSPIKFDLSTNKSSEIIRPEGQVRKASEVIFHSSSKNSKITIKDFVPIKESPAHYNSHLLTMGYDSGRILLFAQEEKTALWKMNTSFTSQVSGDDLMIDFTWSFDAQFLGQLLYDYSVLIWEIKGLKGNIQATKRHLINFTLFDLLSKSGSLKSNLCSDPKEHLFYIFFSDNCYSIKFNQALFSIDLVEFAPSSEKSQANSLKRAESHELKNANEKESWELLREHMEQQFLKPALDKEGKYIFFPKYDQSECLTVHRFNPQNRKNSRFAFKMETNVQSVLVSQFSYVYLPSPFDKREAYSKKKPVDPGDIHKAILNSQLKPHSYLLTIKSDELALWTLDLAEGESCPLEKHMLFQKTPCKFSLAIWLDQYNLILCGELGELFFISFDLPDLGAVLKR